RFVLVILVGGPAFAQGDHRAVKAALHRAEVAGDPDSISYYLAELSSEYVIEKAYDSAEYYCRKALAFNRATGNEVRMAENLNNLGVVHFQRGNLDSCIFYYNAAFDKYTQLQDTA